MKKYVPSHLKHANRRIIYEWVSRRATFSRAEIQRATQISGPTVHKVIRYFLDRQIVAYTGGSPKGSVGRQPSMMRWCPDYAYTANLLVEGDYATLGLVDMAGGVMHLRHWQLRPKQALSDTLTQLPDVIRAFVTESGLPPQKLCAVGIGVPGAVTGLDAWEGIGAGPPSADAKEPVILYAPLIGVERPYPIAALLSHIRTDMRLPVVLENDVNAAAWGAYCMRRAAQDSEDDLVYYSLGTGLGAGIVLNGTLRRGRGGSAGEIGYTCFDPSYVTERDQPGWLESNVNLHALRTRYQYKPGDAADPEMIAKIAEHLSFSMANYQWMLDVDVFMLGGVTARALGEPLLQAVRAQAGRLCFSMPDIETDPLQEAGIIGLAHRAADTMLAGLLREDE